MEYRNKFNFDLRPSRYYFTLISGLHLVVLFCACIVEMPWWLLFIILLFITVSYLYLISKYVYRKSSNVVVKLWQRDSVLDPNVWQLQFKNKVVKNARLQSKGYSSDYLVILYFDVERTNRWSILLSSYKLFNSFKYKTVSVLIFPDMLDYKDYIALRRFLNGY